MPEGGHPSHHSITSSASDLAQNYFSRISWIVSIVLYPITGLLDDSPCACKREPAHDRPMPDVTGATFDHPQIAPTAA